MMKFGIHNAYANKDWFADYDMLIKKVSSLGFDVLECNPGTFYNMPKEKRHDLKMLAKDCGLKLIFSFGLPQKYDVSSEDEQTRQNGVNYMKDVLSVVHEMDSDLIAGCIYSYWPYNYITGTKDRRKLADNSVKSLKELMKPAEDYGIDYSIEVVNRFENILLNTTAEAIEFVKRVGSPRAKINLDTFHMNIEEASVNEALILCGDYLTDIHAGERNRTFPGMGDFDWDSFTQTLVDMDYQKYFVLEPFMITGGEVGSNVYLWRDLTGGATTKQINDMAKESLEFLKEMVYQKEKSKNG